MFAAASEKSMAFDIPAPCLTLVLPDVVHHTSKGRSGRVGNELSDSLNKRAWLSLQAVVLRGQPATCDPAKLGLTTSRDSHLFAGGCVRLEDCCTPAWLGSRLSTKK